MPDVTLEVRPRTARGARIGSLVMLRALAALASLSCASLVVAAPFSAHPDRPNAIRDGQPAAPANAVDFAHLPSVVGTEYLRNGFESAGHRAIFVLRPVNLPDLIRVREVTEVAQATSLAPEEVWVGDVIVKGADLRRPSGDLEQFYDQTLRAIPPPAPGDAAPPAFLGTNPDRGVESSVKTLDDYLSTPEPASLVLLCAGGVLLLRRRRG